MKNKKILIPAAVLAAVVVIGLLVWLVVSLTRPGISEIGLPTEMSIAKGETAQLEIEYGAEGNAYAEALEKAAAKLTLEWTSSDEEVATVDENGLVTAVEAGTADITVSVPDTALTSTCKVTVTVPVEGVQVPDEMQLTINETASKEIGAKLVPEDATGVKLVYESSDENIATVDENGVVTAVTKGECVITTSVQPIAVENENAESVEDVGAISSDVSASDPTDASAPTSAAANKTADSGSEPAGTEETLSVDYSSMTAETKVYVVTAATGLKLSSDSGSVKVGNSVNVSVYIESEEANTAKAEDVKYTSSDESVATVVGTTEGEVAFTVKGVKAGNATITIEYQGLTATYEVTVTKATQTSSGGGSNTGTSTSNNSTTLPDSGTASPDSGSVPSNACPICGSTNLINGQCQTFHDYTAYGYCTYDAASGIVYVVCNTCGQSWPRDTFADTTDFVYGHALSCYSSHHKVYITCGYCGASYEEGTEPECMKTSGYCSVDCMIDSGSYCPVCLSALYIDGCHNCGYGQTSSSESAPTP